jgi:hypothetical protein
VVKKPEEKRQLERPRSRCDNNINIDLKETGRKGVCWFHLASRRAVVNTLMKLPFPQKMGKLFLAKQLFSHQEEIWYMELVKFISTTINEYQDNHLN